MTERILITGALGFVGQHLWDELAGRGHDVVGVDLAHAVRDNYIRCDVSEYRQLHAIIKDVRPSYVYHLAAEFGRHNGDGYYEQLWRTNVIGARHLLELTPNVRVVLFSSSEVYGNYTGEMREGMMETGPVRQLNEYAMTKWVNEQQARLYSDKREIVCVRLFNFYGPGEPPHKYRSAIANFIYRALLGKSVLVYGGHERSWLYVTDGVRTLANIVGRFHAGQVYNIGSTEAVRMDALAEMVREATGCDPALFTVTDKYEPRTVARKQINVNAATHDLGHAPHTQLRDGLQYTVSWMRREYGL